MGDRSALDGLLRREYDRIYAVCRRITGNDSDGADAAQEALISIVRALPRFDGTSRFGTWTYRIAVNAALDELRRRKRRPEPIDLTTLDRGRPDDTEPIAQRLDLDAALLLLAPEFRAAVVLRDLCGLDYSEIASLLDIPAGTVRSRIARGRAHLADQLTGNPGTSDHRPTIEP